MHSRTNDNIMVGRKRKSQNKVTRARMLMRYYDATKRIGVYERHDNEAMPYPLARRSVYAARSSSYPPTDACERRLSAPSSYHADLSSQDIQDIDIPAAVTKEEEDDPKSLDNKRLIANSVPSSELEVALKAELDKEVKQNELLSAELDKLRDVLSKIQAHQSNEPLPPHSANFHDTAL